MGTLLLQFRLLKSGELNLNVATCYSKMTPCEGRPKTATTPETIEKVQNIVLDDRRVKVCEIGEGIS